MNDQVDDAEVTDPVQRVEQGPGSDPEQYPELVSLSPCSIKFNQDNPRRHTGTDYVGLQQSTKELGLVQLPTVRELEDGTYECLDGEGRILAAQDHGEERIWVVNKGPVSDADALLMLQAANSVRSFGVLAECRGLAELRRQGISEHELAAKLGSSIGTISQKVGVGFLPAEIQELIQQDIVRSEVHTKRWTTRLLYELLSLRQRVAGRDPANSPTLDGVYEYTDVYQMVEDIVTGRSPAKGDGETIANSATLIAAVKERKRKRAARRDATAVVGERVGEAAAQQVAAELSAANELREREQALQRATAEFKRQSTQAQEEYKELQKCVWEILKGAEPGESPQRIWDDLRREMAEHMEARKRYEALQQQMKQDVRRQVALQVAHLRPVLEREIRKDLAAAYRQRANKRLRYGPPRIRQEVGRVSTLLTVLHAWLDEVMTPFFLDGLAPLPAAQVGSFLEDIEEVLGALEHARSVLLPVYAGSTHETRFSTADALALA